MSRWERWFGTTRRTLRYRLKESNLSRDAQAHRAIKAEKEIKRLKSLIADLATEPAQPDTCDKVRLHSQVEAWAWASRIAMNTRVDARIYKTYRCTKCPHHPLIGPYWHVAHSVPGWMRVAKASRLETENHA